MDDFPEIKPLEEQDPVEEGLVEEDNEEESLIISGDYFSYSSTDTSIDLDEYKHLLHEPSETFSVIPSPPQEDEVDSDDEQVIIKSESAAVEILSEQSSLSDESAWEKEEPERLEIEESFIEELTEVKSEPFRDTKDELEEDVFEQTLVETEETVEEEDLEEELVEPELFEEWEKERRIAQFQRDLEEMLSYEFPDDVNQEEEMKLQAYESMLRELEKEDKEIDIMLKELEKNEKTIHVIERTLGPLITHYEKEVCAFRKVGDDGFADLEGEEEEEDVEDEYMSRAAEMAKEILEADDIESVGSLGKESSGDDLSNMLSQMAADLKESEPEAEKEEQTGSKKAPTRQKRKNVQVKRVSRSNQVRKRKK